MSLRDSVLVGPVEKSIAVARMEEHHYSGSVVWSSHTHHGVWLDGTLVGVLQYGPMMNPRVTRTFTTLSPREVVELNRMYFEDGHPQNLPSYAIAASLRLLRAARPYVHLVRSFADERCGKLGAVYQASNFRFVGQHQGEFYLLDGEWFHKSLLNRAPVDKRGWTSGPKAARLRAGKERAVKHVFMQYQYLKPLTHRGEKSILLPALPFPKAGVV